MTFTQGKKDPLPQKCTKRLLEVMSITEFCKVNSLVVTKPQENLIPRLKLNKN